MDDQNTEDVDDETYRRRLVETAVEYCVRLGPILAEVDWLKRRRPDCPVLPDK